MTFVLSILPAFAMAQLPWKTDFENFDSGHQQGWSSDKGIWQVGTPTAGPKAAYRGVQCAATLLAGNYPTGSDSRFISPMVVLPTSIGANQSIMLGFWQWFQFGGGFYYSYGDVEVRVWDGSSYGAWIQVSRQITSSSPGWSYCAVDLSAYVNKKIQFAFHHVGRDYSSVGWMVDDVGVSLVGDADFDSLNDVENFSATTTRGWYADNGIWQFGAPTGGPEGSYRGSQCAATLLAGKYPTGTDSRLISPAVTLPSIDAGQGIVFGFWQWFQFGGGFYYSYGEIEISFWNGTAWSGWQQLSRNITGGSPGWSYDSVDLSPYAGKRVRVALHHVGRDYTGEGWYADDFRFSLVRDLAYNRLTDFENASATDTKGWWSDNGNWQFGTPTAGPKAAYRGKQCAATLLKGSYATGTDSRLVSPPISLPSVDTSQSISLGFWQWFSFGGGFYYSYGQVEISSWTGTTWSDWKKVSNEINGSSPGWSFSTIDLSAYAGKRIQIAFHHVGRDYTGVGWLVDDLTVFATPRIDTFDPTSGYPETTVVTINGALLKDATSVKFNGVSASPITVLSDTQLQVTVPKNATTGPISVSTPGGTATSSQTFTVLTPIAISSLTFAPSALCPTMTTTGTVTVSTAAPAGGLVVNLASDNATALPVPASVTIPVGATSATFTATAGSVNLSTTVNVTASYNASSVSTPVTVNPWVKSVDVSPTAVTAGTPATMTITLNSSAPAAGLTIPVGSNNGAANPVDGVTKISSVKIAAGQTTATVTIATYATAFAQTATLFAGDGPTPPTCTLTINSGGATLTLAPTTVAGGVQSSKGFVTLSALPPSGGLDVAIASSDPAAVVPLIVHVPAGKKTAPFDITTTMVSKTVKVNITATLGTTVSTKVLTVTPIATLTLIPSAVSGGDNAIGLITLLGGPAVSDISVKITSSKPTAAAPDGTIVIKAGSTMETFNIDTFSVATSTKVTITATVKGQKITATLTVNP